jgi:peptidoglycan/LPS O-acetylase OafA/YrhL
MKVFPGLNTLRGIGALMIVIHHANPDSIPNMTEVTGIAGFLLWRLRNLGWSGIDLFLVLSGFLMADFIFARLQRRNDLLLSTYWKKRAIRIIPSYYFLLIVLAFTGASGFISFLNAEEAVKSALIHFFFLNNYLDQVPNGPTWYVSVIVQCYVALPVMVAILVRTTKIELMSNFLKISCAVVLLSLVLRVLRVLSGAHEANDFMLTHFRLDSIFIGMSCMYLLSNRHPFITFLKKHQAISLIVSILLIAPCMYFPRKNPFMFTIGFTLLACGYGVIILLLAEDLLEGAANWLKWFSVLAAWSYNIYLWHYFMPSILGKPYLGLQNFIVSWSNSAPIRALLEITLFVSLSIVVGYLMTVIIERPAERVLSRRKPIQE